MRRNNLQVEFNIRASTAVSSGFFGVFLAIEDKYFLKMLKSETYKSSFFVSEPPLLCSKGRERAKYLKRQICIIKPPYLTRLNSGVITRKNRLKGCEEL